MTDCCTNRIGIYANSTRDMIVLRELIGSQGQCFDFERIKAMPKELEKLDTTPDVRLAYEALYGNYKSDREYLSFAIKNNISTQNELVQYLWRITPESMTNAIDLKKLTRLFGFKNWNEWREVNWGAVWNIEEKDITVLDESEYDFNIEFDTDYRPPLGIYNELISLIAKLDLDISVNWFYDIPSVREAGYLS